MKYAIKKDEQHEQNKITALAAFIVALFMSTYFKEAYTVHGISFVQMFAGMFVTWLVGFYSMQDKHYYTNKITESDIIDVLTAEY